MFFVIGTKFITWGWDKMDGLTRCSECGALTNFTEKTGMRFITLFFVIPVIPISGKKKMIECPNCKARYQTV